MTRNRLPFGRFAADYDANRPGYPETAVEWLLEGTSGPVVELGAGSGKLTRLLADRCASTLALEPDPDMLAQLNERLPDVPTALGSAESIPVSESSVGVVLAAQAWHWFDPTLAWREIRRVLAPGGRLGVIWNAPSSRPSWQRRLAAGVPSVSPVSEEWWPRGMPREGTERRFFYWREKVRPNELAEEYATHLVVRNAGEKERVRIQAHVRAQATAEAKRLDSEFVMYERLTWCARRGIAPPAD